MSDFLQSEQYLRERNQERMRGLPAEIQAMLSMQPPHIAAEFLDSYGDKYRAQPDAPQPPQLSEQQRRVARASNLTDQEYLELVKKYTPTTYDQMEKGPTPENLSPQQRAAARAAGMTEAEYISAMRKAQGGNE